MIIENKDFILMRPNEKYAEDISAYRQEFLDSGDSMDGCGSLRRIEDPIEFIQKCKDYEFLETLPEGRVLATQFLFIRKTDDKILGMIQVRHYFNEYLEKYSGHIGYSVRTSERRKGYAKKMLEMTLPFCKTLNINKVLISCLDGNIGSEKTILANGGVYESTVHEPQSGRDLKRFWVDIG